MNVKLSEMAALDPEWATELKVFLEQNGICETDYLEWTYAEFLRFSEEYIKKLAEVLRKRDHKI